MLELRVYTGLHRGATIPLGDESLSLGSGEDADIVLVDPGISALHARLELQGGTWLLRSQEGKLYAEQEAQQQTEVYLEPGDFACLEDVWIGLAWSGDGWQAAPKKQQEKAVVHSDVSPGAADFSEDPIAKGGTKPRSSRRIRRSATLAAVVAVVLSAAAAYAMTGRPAADQINTQTRLQISPGLSPELEPASTQEQMEKHPESLAELQMLLRKKLTEADLMKYVDLQLSPELWEVRADLNAEQGATLDRILEKFRQEHTLGIPINSHVVNTEQMLPFKIRQVISGKNASLVTEDGQRFFVGEEYRGIRLLGIEDNKISLLGKRKIEMNW
ncbi:FHA domain-containing protein [Undibacterium sp. TS12]|uniref:FHA domain-containing protein n=1 Tax=Undibacterium sp. TS12 TaxID=2908202 RepID=UPI001F4C695A|nr:FHA domain-containing protein [Undibacterium sp. TS12]MCH8621951.1 hypothetical protein [Undibacterium sp. TS12]